MNSQEIYINKYLPIVILYFFLNGFLLPLGLLYTTLLTPVFLIWLARYPTIKYVPVFFVLIAPFVIIHFINGVDYWYYAKSFALLFSVFVFGLAFYQFLENCHSLRSIYRDILLINAGMVVVSFIFLFLPSVQATFWNDNSMSLGNLSIRRLKMLTYEPSYYSTLFAPIVIYYLLKVFRRELPQPIIYLLLVLIPLFLSLSFGVILGIALAFGIVFLLHSRKIIFKKNNIKYLFGGLLLLAGVLTFLFVFYPDNIFFRRISNVLSGKDLSFNGRTFDSFILGEKIAREESLIWGSGLGQVKLLGLEHFKKFYNNDNFAISDIGIPNNIGDVLATFGLLGVLLKLFVEFYFYFKTKVYNNYYRLALFLFIFIYQFTGSFIMNIAEYAIWILAFKENIFPEFNREVSNAKMKHIR